MLRLFVLFGAVFAISPSAVAQLLPITLYDGRDTRPPEAQSWLWFGDNPAGSAERLTGAGRTRLTTLASPNIQALYGTRTFGSGPNGGAPHPLILSRVTGFRFSLEMRILEEAHQSALRGGFFMRVGTSSARHGIMFFGWEDRLFSWTPDDAVGEIASLDLRTSRELTTTVLGNEYSVSVDGQVVMSGPLRDYLRVDLPPFPANSITFGDINFSSAVDFEFSRAAILPIPEPAHASLVVAGLVAISSSFTRRRGRRRQAGAERSACRCRSRR